MRGIRLLPSRVRAAFEQQPDDVIVAGLDRGRQWPPAAGTRFADPGRSDVEHPPDPGEIAERRRDGKVIGRSTRDEKARDVEVDRSPALAPEGEVDRLKVQRVSNVDVRAPIEQEVDGLMTLSEHGADPHEDIDSTSRALAFAATPDVREFLESYEKGPDIWEATWVDDDDALRSVAADPAAHLYRIGAAITMNADRPDRLARLLDAGLRMPAVHTACQGYLINAGALRALLAHGMSPDQMNWQHQTLLHLASTKETSECAAILVDAGASMTARDDEYLSTPLAWAARTNRPEVVEFLLSRGAPVALPDDQPWATPLAWAQRRGHQEIVSILRAHGATK